jgi:hypothetical protein
MTSTFMKAKGRWIVSENTKNRCAEDSKIIQYLS